MTLMKFVSYISYLLSSKWALGFIDLKIALKTILSDLLYTILLYFNLYAIS